MKEEGRNTSPFRLTKKKMQGKIGCGGNVRRRLSQVFLTSQSVLGRIVDSAELSPGERVMEIGAGTGNLTTLLTSRVKLLLAFEIDPRLCETLRSRLAHFPSLKILNQDFLAYPLEQESEEYILMGNIPYHITTPLLEKVIAHRYLFPRVIWLVQKEVAQRISASPGSKVYGRLSIFVQYFYDTEILFTVSRRNFRPVPAVDSAVIRLRRRAFPPVEVPDEKFFFQVIQWAFAHRRKTVQNALSSHIPLPEIQQALKGAGISPRARAETLSLSDFAILSTFLRQ